jgi:hypothetical protein
MVYKAYGLAEKVKRLAFEQFAESPLFLYCALEPMAVQQVDCLRQRFHADWIALDAIGAKIAEDNLKLRCDLWRQLIDPTLRFAHVCPEYLGRTQCLH